MFCWKEKKKKKRKDRAQGNLELQAYLVYMQVSSSSFESSPWTFGNPCNANGAQNMPIIHCHYTNKKINFSFLLNQLIKNIQYCDVWHLCRLQEWNAWYVAFINQSILNKCITKKQRLFEKKKYPGKLVMFIVATPIKCSAEALGFHRQLLHHLHPSKSYSNQNFSGRKS